MTRFTFSTQESSNPLVDSTGAIESVAELTPGVRIITQVASADWTDGALVEVYAECGTVEQGNTFLRSLDAFGLLR